MANIGGLKFIGMQSQSANPLAEIIAQIQQGTMGGYQSGQALGLNFLKMQPEQLKPVSEKEKAMTSYYKKRTEVLTAPSVSDKEISQLISNSKNIQSQIEPLQKQIDTIEESFYNRTGILLTGSDLNSEALLGKLNKDISGKLRNNIITRTKLLNKLKPYKSDLDFINKKLARLQAIKSEQQPKTLDDIFSE